MDRSATLTDGSHLVTQQSWQVFTERCDAASCRSCGQSTLKPVLDLGKMPLADGLLNDAQLAEHENRYPLELAFCSNCALVQILETVPPEILFGHDYPYFSSFSDALLAHSRDNALDLIERRNLEPGEGCLVVELASNDGYLLKNFVEKGINVLGIDPAPGPAKAAEEIGVPTLCDFFTENLAGKLANEGKQADVIIANNVLAHVADTNGFVRGIRTLLKDGGAAVIEVPYVRELIEHGEFDTIYHEHLCYFSVCALDALFRQNGLFLNDVKPLAIHGGSLRLYVEKHERPSPVILEMLSEERALGLDRYEYFKNFSERVLDIRSEMQTLLNDLREQGKTIAGYGAAAKGAIMLNFIGAGTDVIDYVVDRNVHKQGLHMPGTHQPIPDPARILQEMPDYVVILPWNFKDEIMSQQQEYRDKGGQFIIPIPKPHVV
ncbi:MAG TPA: class I SAM-dependent methyltransferase [Phycisphaerae bacterium]|nr:class I SAM-dependent methyltransferase [Phycisphaerae bacterium]